MRVWLRSGTPGLPHRVRVTASKKERHARPKRGALSTPRGGGGMVSSTSTQRNWCLSACIFMSRCIYLDVTFCRYWGNSAACGVGRVADVDEVEATGVTCRGVKQ